MNQDFYHSTIKNNDNYEKLRKISRSEMKTVSGGIAKGMVRCKDPNTCALKWGWPTGFFSNCSDSDVICGPAPAVDPCETAICL